MFGVKEQLGMKFLNSFLNRIRHGKARFTVMKCARSMSQIALRRRKLIFSLPRGKRRISSSAFLSRFETT